MSGKGGNEWTFRVALDDEIMAHTFARYMAEPGREERPRSWP